MYYTLDISKLQQSPPTRGAWSLHSQICHLLGKQRPLGKALSGSAGVCGLCRRYFTRHLDTSSFEQGQKISIVIQTATYEHVYIQCIYIYCISHTSMYVCIYICHIYNIYILYIIYIIHSLSLPLFITILAYFSAVDVTDVTFLCFWGCFTVLHLTTVCTNTNRT